MKALASSVLILSLLTLKAQNNTFNAGWKTTAEQILCTGKTLLVSGDASAGLGTAKYIMKLKNSSAGLTPAGVVHAFDTIIDFRFHDGHLYLLTVKLFDCDYYPPRDTTLVQIDTGAMKVITAKRLSLQFDLTGASFVSDSSLFVTGQLIGPSYFVDFGLNVLDSIETFTPHSLHIHSLFDEKYLLQQSKWGDLSLTDTSRLSGTSWYPNDPSYSPRFVIATMMIPPIRYSIGYAADSIALVTSDKIYKTDTGLSSFRIFTLPPYTRFLPGDTTYRLIQGNELQHFRLSSHALLQTDSLKAPTRMTLKDWKMDGADTLLLVGSQFSIGLNELSLSKNWEITYDTGTSVKIDGFRILSDTFIPKNSVYNRKLACEATVTNTGTDTMHYFKFLYHHSPSTSLCGYSFRTKEITTPLAPGQSMTIIDTVNLWNKGNLCFNVSVPNHALEADLTDNQTCLWVPLSNDEVEDRAIEMFPNPARNQVHLMFDQPVSGQVILTDLRGRHCMDNHFESSSELKFEVGRLSPGIYLVKCLLDDGRSFINKLRIDPT